MTTTIIEPANATSMTSAIHTNERWFWPLWAFAFVGFPIRGVAGAGVAGPVDTVTSAALAGAATGAVIGAAQWLVLRRRLPISPWWIAATGVGMAAGMVIATNAEQATARREALRECTRLDAESARLRASALKEKQIAQQVDLNLELKRVEAQLATARGRL